jgi:hypothetical protein
MDSYQDTFALFAELSLGLAGFAGVAAAFGGRHRSYRPGDENRLVGLFVSAGVTLAGCVAILTLIATDMAVHNAFLLVSALLFAVSGMVTLKRVPLNYRLAQDAEASIEPWAAHLASLHFAALLLLYGGNLWLGGRAWPLIGGFSLQLLFGLWLFTRLLTRST